MPNKFPLIGEMRAGVSPQTSGSPKWRVRSYLDKPPRHARERPFVRTGESCTLSDCCSNFAAMPLPPANLLITAEPNAPLPPDKQKRIARQTMDIYARTFPVGFRMSCPSCEK